VRGAPPEPGLLRLPTGVPDAAAAVEGEGEGGAGADPAGAGGFPLGLEELLDLLAAGRADWTLEGVPAMDWVDALSLTLGDALPAVGPADDGLMLASDGSPPAAIARLR